MNAIEQAIKEAVENGFDNQVARDHLTDWRKFETLTSHDYGWIFNRPEFWQALEKAKHWYAGEWKQKAMSFFEHVVCDDKDAESFFAELLR